MGIVHCVILGTTYTVYELNYLSREDHRPVAIICFIISEIWAQAYLPPRLNKEHITQYPMLVNV